MPAILPSSPPLVPVRAAVRIGRYRGGDEWRGGGEKDRLDGRRQGRAIARRPGASCAGGAGPADPCAGRRAPARALPSRVQRRQGRGVLYWRRPHAGRGPQDQCIHRRSPCGLCGHCLWVCSLQHGMQELAHQPAQLLAFPHEAMSPSCRRALWRRGGCCARTRPVTDRTPSGHPVGRRGRGSDLVAFLPPQPAQTCI